MVTMRTVFTAAALVTMACHLPGEEKLFVPPTADEDPLLPQDQLTVGGLSYAIHLETFGDEDDPLVLALHDSLGDYRALGSLEDLSDDRFVVMWDRRGNGLSERIGASEISDELNLEEISAVYEAYGHDDPATLIGFGEGAALAAAWTGAHPDEVEALVLIEAAPLRGDILTSNYDAIARDGLIDPSFQEQLWQGEVVTPGDHARMDYRAVTVVQNGGLFLDHCTDNPMPPPLWRPGAFFHTALKASQKTGFDSFAYDYTIGLSDWSGEALLVAGSCSAIGSVFQQQHHLPLFANAKLVEITGAGHAAIVEQSDEVVDAIRAHLDD